MNFPKPDPPAALLIGVNGRAAFQYRQLENLDRAVLGCLLIATIGDRVFVPNGPRLAGAKWLSH